MSTHFNTVSEEENVGMKEKIPLILGRVSLSKTKIQVARNVLYLLASISLVIRFV